MKSLIRIYKHNIYGIIGTLVFHILLVGVLLVAGVNRKGLIRENALEVQIPVELLENTEITDKAITVKQQEQNPEGQKSGELMTSELTNRPSNRGFTSNRDKFFDENYEREVAEATKLVSDVNKQLSKEITDINNIKMPEDVTEGKKAEDIKNIVYTGKSNIEYHLGNRHHLRLPIPVYLAKGGGVVIVDIAVNREGNVISAKVRPNSSITDEQVYFYSQVAAQRTVFNADQSAPATQNGTIRYTFIPQ